MGLGKTILMGTCIFYEFLLANKYPKDKRFCHNAKDNYSKNYRHFQELFDKHSTENPLMVYQFIYAL